MKQRLSRRQLLKSTGALAGAAYFGFADCAYARESFDGGRSNRTPDGMIRLSSNENPFGPSDKARAAMAAAADIAHQYPRGPLDELTKAIARHEDLSPDHVLLGAGSYEILSLAAIARLHGGGNVVAPDPTFWAIMSYAAQFGATWKRVPVDEGCRMDLEALARAVDGETGVIYLCNPNNPTGTAVDNAKVGEFCAGMNGGALIVADEAYGEFIEPDGFRSLAPMVDSHRSLLVAKTFSKIYGLAGMRVGYALGHPDLVRAFKTLQTGQGVGISAVSAAGALASYRDEAFMKLARDGIIAARKKLTDYFEDAGITFIPSVTNFICFDPGRYGEGMADRLRERRVMVRMATVHEKPWCRVSITIPDDMAFFISALSGLMAQV